ncbi:MAG: hypothetical protein C4521_08995 [Actinobacteria bacterium]|nr:MAG: hypothetical protein C4521_08995 [Actinomycetota bacterium]
MDGRRLALLLGLAMMLFAARPAYSATSLVTVEARTRPKIEYVATALSTGSTITVKANKAWTVVTSEIMESGRTVERATRGGATGDGGRSIRVDGSLTAVTVLIE